MSGDPNLQQRCYENLKSSKSLFILRMMCNSTVGKIAQFSNVEYVVI